MNILIHGDSLEILKVLDENSIDSVVCDPPYELNFMGKGWDGTGIANSKELWKLVLRALKPGGHLLAFGGTRTFHRMTCAIEDAGFEIRDCMSWLYGSGFPKSQDVSKAIDKQAWAKREVVGKQRITGQALGVNKGLGLSSGETEFKTEWDLTKPTTDAAKQWNGWGTALKPAWEPIIVARKPLSEKTVAANVLKWGTGAINIDKSRIGVEERTYKGSGAQPNKLNNHAKGDTGIGMMDGSGKDKEFTVNGRWPANLILDSEAGELLDEQSGECKTGALKPYKENHKNASSYKFERDKTYLKESDSGGASRFFFNTGNTCGGKDLNSRFMYCPKVNKKEREMGCEDLPTVHGVGTMQGDADGSLLTGSGNPRDTSGKNHHPTVKPIKLMAYLCNLVTPPNGTILDPFAGSGSTGIAAIQEGFNFIGIEKEAEYVTICKHRLLSLDKDLDVIAA